jgi:hypothetical protein
MRNALFHVKQCQKPVQKSAGGLSKKQKPFGKNIQRVGVIVG